MSVLCLSFRYAENVYNADIHCGVWVPNLNKNCTRSLACKVLACFYSNIALFFSFGEEKVGKKRKTFHVEKVFKEFVFSSMCFGIYDVASSYFMLCVLAYVQTHSLNQRRRVSGRTGKFDEMLAEHKKARLALRQRDETAGLGVKPLASVKESNGAVSQ